MQHTNITIRVPVPLVEAIDQLALDEAERTGLRVDRSSVVRRALTEDLERRKQAEQKEGGDEE